MKRPARVPSQLSDSLPPRLNAYALAAGAAGLGRLALPQPVEARIVYTRANEVIQGGSLLLDLNHHGITDFVFQRNLSAHFSTSLRIGAYNNSNRTWGSQNKKNGQKLASALPAGLRIRNSPHFSLGFKSGTHDKLMWFFFQSCTSTHGTHCITDGSGQWKPNTNRYLGLKFQIKRKTHYGWARVSFIKGTATLLSYAYETIPNKPIKANQTHGKDDATLGRLATGDSAWHVKQTAATIH